MKFFSVSKDGGPESTVTGYWLVEIKSLFSIGLLKFENGSRDAYHEHAFDCISWVLTGDLEEDFLLGHYRNYYRPSLKPVFTFRDTFHKVKSRGTTWVFTIRGPWRDTWRECIPGKGFVTLTHGRKEMP